MSEQIVSKSQINRLFAALRKQGMLARQNFSCCSGCAVDEITGLPGYKDATGVVYYHQQDAEVWSGRSGKTLMLRFGVSQEDAADAAIAAVGHEVVKVATSLGLPTTWNGDAGECISVQVWS
jgi:hypothetical protein